MEREDDSAPAFKLSREPGGLRIRLPVRAGTFHMFLNSVWLLVWIAAGTAAVLLLLGRDASSQAARSVPLPVVLLFLGAFGAAGVVVLGRWLWCMGGEESFLVSRFSLGVSRGVWGLGRLRRFAPKRIRSILSAPLEPRVMDPVWGRLFVGHGDGQVVIDCAGASYRYGKGLESPSAPPKRTEGRAAGRE
jgi:hypothetical protein